jgi:hypothetical protein
MQGEKYQQILSSECHSTATFFLMQKLSSGFHVPPRPPPRKKAITRFQSSAPQLSTPKLLTSL